MRVLVSAVGTRGDVQPAVAVAVEVRRLGHDVRLCVSPNFMEWVAELGFEATPVGVEMRHRRSGPGSAPSAVAPAPERLRQLRPTMPDLITDQFDAVGSAAKWVRIVRRVWQRRSQRRHLRSVTRARSRRDVRVGRAQGVENGLLADRDAARGHEL